jgi:hypothetical protein
MDYPRKCHNCEEIYCKKDCSAMIKMEAMDTARILAWAKEHNGLHNQIEGEFRIFSIKCKHAGIITNEIFPHVSRCFHSDASNYTPGFTNCSTSRCPLLNLKRY